MTEGSSRTSSESATIDRAHHLAGVHYELRGPLARRALELERGGASIIKLNIGNPAIFGFRASDAIVARIAEKLVDAEGYSHEKGILPAREAIARHAIAHGLVGVTSDDVVIGNGVSELIGMCTEALLDPGDEVLVPAPDYPLWTAAVTLTGARAVHYPCRPENGFVPDPAELEAQVTARTKALVIINPNNPTGAVYPRATLEALVALAERRGLVVFADEIYDRILYDGASHVSLASLCKGTLCASFNGFSKVHLACGFRTGWVVFTGDTSRAKGYLAAVELLASLRLCPNVPPQWAIPVALAEEPPSIALTAPGGRLHRQRLAILRGVEASRFFRLVPPRGALYAFPRVDRAALPSFQDRAFAMELLEREHVLVIPGSSFNVSYTDHLRLTFLPDEETIATVFARMERLLAEWATRS
jgi:alanine-synthesizing transaminase